MLRHAPRALSLLAVAAGSLAAAWGMTATGAVAAATSGPAPAAAAPAAETPAGKPPAKPIATAKNPVGNLLRKWWAEGTAAGNEGDWYDNRDRGHSALNIAPWPQLQKVAYTDQELQRRADWALQGRVLPHVVFGNSSTSAGATSGGSNARMACSHPAGLAMLYTQYRHNNLYIYPEHQDHDPGRNGSPGYGDLFPTNTPYVVTAQGSSGSDQPFLRAMPGVLAAFRPEVKRKLVETGLLMPTVQMLLRRTGKPVASKAAYLTGKAHPTVFDGSWVNEQAMVEAAHALTLDAIPPMVQLAVTEEDSPVRGRDFFDLHSSEHLGDTPAVLARIFRGRHEAHRMVVSAEASFDVNQRPLRFHWVVLRGDAGRIGLKPMNEAGSVCEVVVPWHERRPVTPGAALESNRVDIGVFVHNGAHYSAPGFITVFCLDDEARTFDSNGRLLEIGYGAGTLEVAVANWPAALDLYKADADGPGPRLLAAGLTPAALAAIAEAAGQYRKARADADAAQAAAKPADEEAKKAKEDLKAAERRRDEAKAAQDKSPADAGRAALEIAEADTQSAQDAAKKADGRASEARKASEAARKAADEVLTRRRNALKGSVKELVEGTLRRLAESPTFYGDCAKEIAAAAAADAGKRTALEAARRRLAGFGLLKEGPPDTWNLTPVRDGQGPAADRLTLYERALLAQFNAEVLSRLCLGGAATVSYKRNYVDPRIALPKSWRDIYRYNAAGDCIGWTRYDGAARTEFDPWGLVVLEKDSLGRCIKGQGVKYELPGTVKDFRGLSAGPLKMVLEPGVTEYEYAGPDDWRGRVKQK